MALDLSALEADFAFTNAGGAAAPLRAALSRFVEDPGNPRFEPDGPEFDGLVADVRARGILQPVVVRREESDVLRIRFGARRIRAARAAGLADAPYVVTEDERQFDDYAQVAENEQRRSLQPLELARFIATRLAAGELKKDVAAKLHVDPAAVTHLLALTGDVPGFILELYHGGRCRVPRYLYELRRLGERDAELVQRRCAESAEIGKRVIESLDVALGAGIGSRKPRRKAGGVGDDSGPPVTGARQPSSGTASTKHSTGDIAPGSFAMLREPCLMGLLDGVEVMVELTLCPSVRGFAVVRDGAGALSEVALTRLQLTVLSEGAHQRVPCAASGDLGPAMAPPPSNSAA